MKSPYTVSTGRLVLVPLNPAQLQKWLENPSALENELFCLYRGEPLQGFFRDIVQGQLKRTKRDPENYPWHSFWFLIRKSDRIVVGSADFKDIPNEQGEVEIGYGLGTCFTGQGYMSEAVEALCRWAFQQEDVTSVLAETDQDGFASQRVLLRCGFLCCSDRNRSNPDNTLWWRKQNSDVPPDPSLQ